MWAGERMPGDRGLGAFNQAVEEAIHALVEEGYLKPGDRVILTMGDSLGHEGGTNTLRLVQVGSDGYSAHQSKLDLDYSIW